MFEFVKTRYFIILRIHALHTTLCLQYICAIPKKYKTSNLNNSPWFLFASQSCSRTLFVTLYGPSVKCDKVESFHSGFKIRNFWTVVMASRASGNEILSSSASVAVAQVVITDHHICWDAKTPSLWPICRYMRCRYNRYINTLNEWDFSRDRPVYVVMPDMSL